MTSAEDSPASIEDTRRRQLVEVTIDSLAELGYVGTTLAQIATRAGVSPGLVAHYFGDKDGLLDAARGLTDVAQRKAFYAQMMQQEVLDLPITYLWTPRNIVGMSAKLQGFRPVPDGMIRVQGLEMRR